MKKLVDDMSGFCRHSQLHHLCSWGSGYETPSAIITCICACHGERVQQERRVLVPKGQSAATQPTRVLVPKS